MLDKICATVREAGKMITDIPYSSVKSKTMMTDFVTDRDVAVQKFLYDKLRTLFPGAGFCGEEDEAHALDADDVFVIDPIDGTANFVYGLGASAVSVALLHKGKAKYAAVYDPYRDEMFCAERGRGAFLNGNPIHVTEAPLRKALVDVGTSPYKPHLMRETLKLEEKLLDIAGDTRRIGSAALAGCYVAAGRYALMFELRLCSWDFAAARLITEEAGGAFAYLDGKDHSLTDDPPIAMGSPEAMEKFLALYKEYKKD